jgi:dihydrofolate reductase
MNQSESVIVYHIASSLDAYIADSNGDVDWLSSFDPDASGYREFYPKIDALLMGSRTYEQILGFGAWPYPGKPCWVFTQRRLPIVHPDVVLTTDLPGKFVATLASRKIRRAWLVGGGQLASSFRAERLITEYDVAVVPMILGSGVPLFNASGSLERLKLIKHHAHANGVVQLVYYSDRGKTTII